MCGPGQWRTPGGGGVAVYAVHTADSEPGDNLVISAILRIDYLDIWLSRYLSTWTCTEIMFRNLSNSWKNLFHFHWSFRIGRHKEWYVFKVYFFIHNVNHYGLIHSSKSRSSTSREKKVLSPIFHCEIFISSHRHLQKVCWKACNLVEIGFEVYRLLQAD